MQLKDKITINFKEFFKNGRFDFLKIGQTKEWIIHNFPDPDHLAQFPKIYDDNIWCYGNIELHFNKDILAMIYSDYIDELDGGQSLLLEKWFLKDTNERSLQKIMVHLNDAKIDFQKKTNHYDSPNVILQLESGVQLSFYPKEMENEDYFKFRKRSNTISQNLFQLSSFSLTDFKQL